MLIAPFIGLYMIPMSPDIKRNSYLETNRIQEHTIGQSYNTPPLIYLTIKSVYTQAELFRVLQEESVSEAVGNNFLNIYNAFSEIIKLNLDLYSIYKTEYGTLIIDFERQNNCLFSLEIGKNSIGYFSEINGETKHFVESLPIEHSNFEISTNILNKDLSSFLMEDANL